MAEEYDAKRSLENLERYAAGGLAYYLASSDSERDQLHVRGALENLALDLGASKDLLEIFVQEFLSSKDKEAISNSISKGNKSYTDALGKLRLGDLYNHYKLTINNYVEDKEKKEKIKNAFYNFREESYGDIAKKVKEAIEVLDNKKKGKLKNILSDEHVSKAQSVLQTYGGVYDFIEKLEGEKFDALRPDVAKRTHKQRINEAAEKL